MLRSAREERRKAVFSSVFSGFFLTLSFFHFIHSFIR